MKTMWGRDKWRELFAAEETSAVVFGGEDKKQDLIPKEQLLRRYGTTVS